MGRSFKGKLALRAVCAFFVAARERAGSAFVRSARLPAYDAAGNHCRISFMRLRCFTIEMTRPFKVRLASRLICASVAVFISCAADTGVARADDESDARIAEDILEKIYIIEKEES